MRLTACIDPPTPDQRYADDCDVSSWAGKPVTLNFNKDACVGIVICAWVKNGGLYAEIEIANHEIVAGHWPRASVP